MNLFNTQNFERQGNTENDIHLDTLDQIMVSSIELCSQALRSIKIFTPDMEHYLYDNDNFRKSLLDFSRGNRHAQIQILVKDTKKAIHQGHQLIRLEKHLTSSMKIRLMPEEYMEVSASFLLIDQSHFIYKTEKSHSNALISKCLFRSKRLNELFSAAWEPAEPDPQLRSFNI